MPLLPRVNNEKPIAGLMPVRYHEGDPYKEYLLRGSAKDRRKQFRAIERAFIGYPISKHSIPAYPYLISRQVQIKRYQAQPGEVIEEANKVQTLIRIKMKGV